MEPSASCQTLEPTGSAMCNYGPREPDVAIVPLPLLSRPEPESLVLAALLYLHEFFPVPVQGDLGAP